MASLLQAASFGILISCLGISLARGNSGDPKNNLLTKANQDRFTFSVYPTPASSWGQPRNVADEHQSIFATNWQSFGIYTRPDAEGIAYLQVDLKTPYIVRSFAVSGYAGGGHKPTGSFFLEGSNDGTSWKMVALGDSDQWHAPGTYPFLRRQIVDALYPDNYRYYRVIAKGWTQKQMLIQNLGLFC